MTDSFQPLYKAIQAIVPLPDEEWSYFVQHISICSVSKGEHVLQLDEVPMNIYFCIRGLFRMYYITEDGKEFNKSFCAEDDFITSYGALLTGRPSTFSIEALEDSKLVTIPYDLMLTLFEREVHWERLGRKLAENLYVKKEQKERQFLVHSADERYRLFLQEYPGLENRIPQYHISSYLGITPVSLSRIRKSRKS